MISKFVCSGAVMLEMIRMIDDFGKQLFDEFRDEYQVSIC